jgi:hypothetical protein
MEDCLVVQSRANRIESQGLKVSVLGGLSRDCANAEKCDLSPSTLPIFRGQSSANHGITKKSFMADRMIRILSWMSCHGLCKYRDIVPRYVCVLEPVLRIGMFHDMFLY